jgi:hypothetical protein
MLSRSEGLYWKIQLKSIPKGISCTDLHTFLKSNIRLLKNSDLQRHLNAQTKRKMNGELATDCKLHILYILFSSCQLALFGYPDWGFSVLFLSSNANARVQLAKTGHGPHSSQLADNFYAVNSSLILFRPFLVRIPESLPTKVVNCVVLCIVCV